MQLGKFDTAVTIEGESRTPNGQGGFTLAWSTFATRRAEVIGTTGDESLKVAVERAVTRWRVTMRSVQGLTAKHRLKFTPPFGGETIGNILSVVPAKQRGFTVVSCESGLQ